MLHFAMSFIIKSRFYISCFYFFLNNFFIIFCLFSYNIANSLSKGIN